MMNDIGLLRNAPPPAVKVALSARHKVRLDVPVAGDRDISGSKSAASSPTSTRTSARPTCAGVDWDAMRLARTSSLRRPRRPCEADA